ncbi:MAG: YhgE/Pip domain-containing protein [Mobilitalea sp.]
MKKLITKRRIICLAVIIAVVIVPLLYSYFYLGAFWDPYSRLESLPVAVVNNDKGALMNDENRNFGNEMCDALKESGELKFVFTDEQTAAEGTEGTDYYAMIVIPENFSADIASASSTDKQAAVVTFSANQKRNYLASQILGSAVTKIEESVRSNVVEGIVEELANNLQSVPDQMTELQDGLGQIGDGSVKLQKGVTTLAEGTATYSDKFKEFQSGITDAQAGSKALADGAAGLSNGLIKLQTGAAGLEDGLGNIKTGAESLGSGLSTIKTGADGLDAGLGNIKTGTDQLVTATKDLGQLTTGAQTLASGAETLNQGILKYTAGVDTLIASVNNTSTFLTKYVTTINPSIMKDPVFAAFITKMADPANAQSIAALSTASAQLKAASAQISAGAGKLSEGSTNLPEVNKALITLSAGITKAKEGSAQLSAGITSAKAGSDQLSAGIASAKEGAGQLSTGIISAKEGSAQLSSGTQSLNSGLTTIGDATVKLADATEKIASGASALNIGAEELTDGIETAKTGVDTAITDADSQIEVLNGLSEFAGAPVTIEQDNVTDIANYGTAFAPYFMSLSLWVGGLILFVGVYLDTEGKFKIMSRDSEHRVARSFLFLLVGIIQAIALAWILQAGLGLKVDNAFLYYASCCLVSLVFISIIQFLMVCLKDVGKLLTIVLLILQLTSCGGTFPMETIPKFFSKLYPFMPMTYSVALFKQSITMPDSSVVLYNVGVLVAILVVFMMATIVFAGAKVTREKKAEAKIALES